MKEQEIISRIEEDKKKRIELIDLDRIRQTDEGFNNSVLSQSDKLLVKRVLTDEEYRLLREKYCSDENGWQLDYAFLLENKCPKCKNNLVVSFIISPPWTWENLCGRAGYKIECLNCECDPYFHIVLLN